MKIARNTRGQTLIEFALVLPLLIMVVMGLFDIGRAVFYYAVLNSAVREGTRFAIVQPYCDYRANPAACTGEFVDLYPVNCADAQSLANTNICSEITEKYFNISELSDATIVIDHCISTTDEPMVEIDIDFLFKPITPGLSLIGDLTIHVNSHMLLAPIALQ